MKVGAMLIRDGRLTPAELDAAMAEQARRGGRLGTVLLEMRLIDADTLTIYLGLSLGIPIATRAALDRAKRAAVRVLSPDLAERFLCVPLLLQDRQLIAAMRDPLDILALDELAVATGYRAIPRVAPEARLHYYLETYYGVPRPARFQELGDLALQGSPHFGADAIEPPSPPLPGLPPFPAHDRPVAVPPAPPLRILAAAGEALALQLLADGDSDGEAEPPPSRPVPFLHGGTAPGEVLDLGEALRRMERSESRASIGDVVLGFSRRFLEVAVLTVVRDDLAFGWKGFGPNLDPDRIETLAIPLAAPSMFRTAVEQAELFVGAAPATPLNAHLFKVLRVEPPPQAVVAPIRIRDRVVNLLYGHAPDESELDDKTLMRLRQVIRAASEAYVRLIALSKRSG